MRVTLVGRLVGFALSSLFALAAVSHVEAQPDRRASVPAPLACGVGWKAGPLNPDRFCLELGAALGRPVLRVDDARTVRLGESVQVFSSSATQWLVAALKDGRVLAWMTVSKAVGKGHEAFVIAGALSALAAVELEASDACVRIRPKNRVRPESDLLYPWEELKKCTPRESELADPWAEAAVTASTVSQADKKGK